MHGPLPARCERSRAPAWGRSAQSALAHSSALFLAASVVSVGKRSAQRAERAQAAGIVTRRAKTAKRASWSRSGRSPARRNRARRPAAGRAVAHLRLLRQRGPDRRMPRMLQHPRVRQDRLTARPARSRSERAGSFVAMAARREPIVAAATTGSLAARESADGMITISWRPPLAVDGRRLSGTVPQPCCIEPQSS